MRFTAPAAAFALLALPVAAPAHLPVGKPAPDFRAQGALGGKLFTVHLKEALKKGPVVLYFYPAAFTPGCTAEAHEFAEASDDFQKAGATVIGMSNDKIEDLRRFSVEACRNKFAVAAANPALIKAYDVGFGSGANMPNLTPERAAMLAAKSNRTSYVIAPDGKIVFVHSDLSYKEHVAKTLAAVRAWSAKNGRKG